MYVPEINFLGNEALNGRTSEDYHQFFELMSFDNESIRVKVHEPSDKQIMEYPKMIKGISEVLIERGHGGRVYLMTDGEVLGYLKSESNNSLDRYILNGEIKYLSSLARRLHLQKFEEF